MAKKHLFTASIKNAGGGGAYVEVPFDVEKEFGSKRPKIRATIEGKPYRGTLVRMGTECHLLIILKSIREKIGKTFGEKIKIAVELDLEPRTVEIPPGLMKELKKNKGAKNFFEKLSYTHQKEYVRFITDAKREETRARRISQAIRMLKNGKKEK